VLRLAQPGIVDGKPLDEPYIYFLPEAGTARQDAFGPVTVPAGSCG
jgi:signal peptidase I